MFIDIPAIFLVHCLVNNLINVLFWVTFNPEKKKWNEGANNSNSTSYEKRSDVVTEFVSHKPWKIDGKSRVSTYTITIEQLEDDRST